MAHYPYLIVGGGMAAAKAIDGIRLVDPEATIGLFSQEEHRPYKRPPLSKKLWQGKPLDSIWTKTEYSRIELHLGREIVTLHPTERAVVDDQGQTYTYEKLLLATGGTPRRLPYGGDQILYFRTLDDYLKLRDAADQGKKFLIIGGGFIGSEIAAALAMNGNQVTIVFPEPGIGARVYPPDLSAYLNDYFQQKGVTVIAGDVVEEVESMPGGLVLKTQKGLELQADVVVAGIGILPNIALAESAGLQVDRGIAVNEYLQTSQPDIYAAGDVAIFPHPVTGKPTRVEHEDNANTMGKSAGFNMAASRTGAEQPKPYHHQPYFYSDMFELGYEAVGSLSSKMDVVSDWEEPYQKGVVYYLEDGRVRGVLLWNVWHQVDAARNLIAQSAQGEKMDAADLKGRLPA